MVSVFFFVGASQHEVFLMFFGSSNQLLSIYMYLYIYRFCWINKVGNWKCCTLPVVESEKFHKNPRTKQTCWWWCSHPGEKAWQVRKCKKRMNFETLKFETNQALSLSACTVTSPASLTSSSLGCFRENQQSQLLVYRSVVPWLSGAAAFGHVHRVWSPQTMREKFKSIYMIFRYSCILKQIYINMRCFLYDVFYICNLIQKR